MFPESGRESILIISVSSITAGALPKISNSSQKSHKNHGLMLIFFSEKFCPNLNSIIKKSQGMMVSTSLFLPTKDKDLSILDLGGLVTLLVNPNRDLAPQFLS